MRPRRHPGTMSPSTSRRSQVNTAVVVGLGLRYTTHSSAYIATAASLARRPSTLSRRYHACLIVLRHLRACLRAVQAASSPPQPHQTKLSTKVSSTNPRARSSTRPTRRFTSPTRRRPALRLVPQRPCPLILKLLHPINAPRAVRGHLRLRVGPLIGAQPPHSFGSSSAAITPVSIETSKYHQLCPFMLLAHSSILVQRERERRVWIPWQNSDGWQHGKGRPVV